jgi:hypothetical protein
MALPVSRFSIKAYVHYLQIPRKGSDSMQEIDCYPLKALKKDTYRAKLLRMNTVHNRQQDNAIQENGSPCCIFVVRRILQTR